MLRTQHELGSDDMNNAYKVRLGDDGATKFSTTDRSEAMEWAKDYSLTNWAGKAQVSDGKGKIATFRDGVLLWSL